MNPQIVNTNEQHYCVGCNTIFRSSRAIRDTCNLQQDCQRNYFENNDTFLLNFDAFDNNKEKR
jgi:hypothetical protein